MGLYDCTFDVLDLWTIKMPKFYASSKSTNSPRVFFICAEMFFS